MLHVRIKDLIKMHFTVLFTLVHAYYPNEREMQTLGAIY